MPTLRRLFAATLFAVPAAAQLAGVYTINPNRPASSANFVSFAAATAELTTQGVAAPVTVDVYDDAGPFTEANSFLPTGLWAPDTAVLVMRSWTGASSTNRITFRAATGEAPVIDASGRAIGVYWGGADYVTIEGFEIRNAVFDAISLFRRHCGRAVRPDHPQVPDPPLRWCWRVDLRQFVVPGEHAGRGQLVLEPCSNRRRAVSTPRAASAT